MTDLPIDAIWSCSHCGVSEKNTAAYCALGCGRDYNKMTEISESIVNAPFSASQFIEDATKILKSHSLTLNEFLRSDIDNLELWELRDLWLMVKGVLERSKRDQLHLQ